MTSFINWLAAGLLLCFAFANSASAQNVKERDMAKEEKIWQQLQKTAPKAVEKFKAATIALDQSNYQEAAKLYSEVLKLSPDFEPALRRGGGALVSLGKREEGLEMTRKAVTLNRSSDNLITHALAITDSYTNKYQPRKSEFAQALSLAKEAMQKDTENSEDYPALTAQFALAAEDINEFNAAVKILKEKHPDSIAAHYFNGIKLANEGNFEAGEAELRQSKKLGMPAESVDEVLALIKTAKSQSSFGLGGNYFYYGAFLVGAWVLGLIILFVTGKILSAKMLKSIEGSDPNDVTGGGHEKLRKIYKKVIAFAGIYYYISQPIVMLLVIVIAATIVLFFLYIGTIPIKLVLVIGFIALATIFYMIKSLVWRAKIEDPGRVLNEDEAPELWALVREVAKAIDTRPVNEIRVTHGTKLAVYERGGWREKMHDKAERVLIVGVAVLNDFSQNAFRAVLAHEYGHFSNRDTAGGDIAMRVDMDIIRLAESMMLSGTTVYNIAFQFLRLYHFIFRRITHGASRLQEILADRVAVHQYGADAFREGLKHVIRREVEFGHIAEREINIAFAQNSPLKNLYETRVQDEQVIKTLEQECEEVIKRPTTEDDTHPSPEDRFKWASQIRSRVTEPVGGMVWDLFKNREALTLEMNNLLEARLKGAA